MCSWSREKLKIIDKEFLALHHKKDSSISLFETVQNVYLFVLILELGVCINMQYFFDVVKNQTSDKKYLNKVTHKKIKSSWKYHATWESFKMINIFQKLQASTIRVWLWLVYKMTKNNCLLSTFGQVHSNMTEVSYIPWHNKHSNLKNT